MSALVRSRLMYFVSERAVCLWTAPQSSGPMKLLEPQVSPALASSMKAVTSHRFHSLVLAHSPKSFYQVSSSQSLLMSACFTLTIRNFWWQINVRKYSSECPDDFQFIKDRVMLCLRLFDKIDPEKVAHFTLNSRWIKLKQIVFSSSHSNPIFSKILASTR